MRAVEPAIHLGQVLCRDGVLRILVEPHCGRDPPARPVPEQLDAVDPASHDRSVRYTPLLIGAERVHHAAVGVRDAVDLPLEEALVHHPRVRVVHERLVVHDGRVRPTLAHPARSTRSEEHTSELQSPCNLVCRLLLEKKNTSELQSPCNLVCRLLLEKKKKRSTQLQKNTEDDDMCHTHIVTPLLAVRAATYNRSCI